MICNKLYYKVPSKLTEWCNDIPFDYRCSVAVSWFVQVRHLLPLVRIWVVSQHIRQGAVASILAS